MFFLGSNANMSTAAANYAGPGTNSWNATEGTVSIVMPSAGTIDTLYVVLSGSPGSTANYQFTLFKNGQAQTPTCNISAAATTCHDTTGCSASVACTDSFTVAAGDTVSIQSCPSASGGTPVTGCSNATNTAVPTARPAFIGVRFLPTTANQAIVESVPTGFPGTNTSTTRFNLFNGSGASEAANTNEQNVLPYTGSTAQTYENMIAVGCWTGSATGTRQVQMQAAGSTQTNPSVTIPSGTNACPSAGSGFATSGQQDSSHTYAPTVPVSSGSSVGFIHTTTSSAPATLTQFKQAFVAVIH